MLKRRIKKWMLAVCRLPLFDWGARLADRFSDGGGRLLRVLTYHRVDEVSARPDLDPGLISATPEGFARQVDWLSRDCNLVSLDEVLSAMERGQLLPKRALLLTFDDAYADFEVNAWPILRERSAPAALFVPTGYPDDPQRSFWWDRLYGAVVRSGHQGRIETPFGPEDLSADSREGIFRRLKQRLKSLPQSELDRAVEDIRAQTQAPSPSPAVLGWSALRRLSDSGVALVPHTHTHPLLDRVEPEVARQEIVQSRDVLREMLGTVRPVLAYPSGHFNEEVANLVREEGFRLAFTTIRGINDLPSSDPIKLRRVNVGRHTPDSLVRFQLTAVSRFLNQSVPMARA